MMRKNLWRTLLAFNLDTTKTGVRRRLGKQKHYAEMLRRS
jgi:hypothetical protein